MDKITGYIAFYKREPDTWRTFKDSVDTYRSLDRTIRISRVTEYIIELTITFTHWNKYRNRASLVLARRMGNLIKFAYSIGEIIWEAPVNLIRTDARPRSLNKDVMKIISKQLDPSTKSQFRLISESHREISPKKINYKIKGIKPTIFYNLTQIYTLEEIAELFIFFPDVVETCLMNGADPDASYDNLIAFEAFEDFNGPKILNCAISKGAQDTAIFIMRHLNLNMQKYLDYDTLLDKKIVAAVYELSEEEIPTKQPSRIPAKDQYAKLKEASYKFESFKILVETYHLNTFSYNDENLLVEALLNSDNYEDGFIPYLSYLKGVEKNFNLSFHEAFFSEVFEERSVYGFMNPKLYTQEELIFLLKMKSSNQLWGEYSSVILSCMALLNDWDLSGITVLDRLDKNSHHINILSCYEKGRELVNGLTEKFISDRTGMSGYYFTTPSKEGLNTETLDQVFSGIDRLATEEEKDNIIISESPHTLFLSLPKRLASRFYDLFAYHSENQNTRDVAIEEFLYTLSNVDEKVIRIALMKKLSKYYPLTSNKFSFVTDDESNQAIRVPETIDEDNVLLTMDKITKEIQQENIYRKVWHLRLEYNLEDVANSDMILKKLKEYLTRNGSNENLRLSIYHRGDRLLVKSDLNDVINYKNSEDNISLYLNYLGNEYASLNLFENYASNFIRYGEETKIFRVEVEENLDLVKARLLKKYNKDEKTLEVYVHEDHIYLVCKSTETVRKLFRDFYDDLKAYKTKRARYLLFLPFLMNYDLQDDYLGEVIRSLEEFYLVQCSNDGSESLLTIQIPDFAYDDLIGEIEPMLRKEGTIIARM